MGENLDGETRIVTTADGRELGVRLWGDPVGAPVFLLHGTPGSRMMRDPTDCYERLHLAVCTYDRPGYGRSTRRRGYTRAQTVDDVALIADALAWERFGVVGVSAGSGAALAAARFLPDRVTRCGLLVPVGPSTIPELQQAMDEEGRSEWEQAVRGDEEALAARFDEFRSWVAAGLPGIELEDAERRMFQDTLVEAARQGPGGFIDDCISDADDWGFAVDDIRVPIWILAGREDAPFMRESARWLAEHIPGAQLFWRPGGHFGAPNDVAEAQLVGWLGHGNAAVPS